jgi:hypothetical protein
MRNGVMGHLGGRSFDKKSAGAKAGGMIGSKKGDVTAKGQYAAMKDQKSSGAYKDRMKARIQEHQSKMLAGGTRHATHLAGTDTSQVHERSKKAKEALEVMDQKKAAKARRKEIRKEANKQAAAARKEKFTQILQQKLKFATDMAKARQEIEDRQPKE